MRYAAVMLPFVAMVAWWLLNTGDAGQKVIVAANEDNIVLYLSNGEKVNISQLDTTGMLESNGMKIVMNGGRDQIVYENQNNTSDELIYNTLSIPTRAEYCLTLGHGTKVWFAVSGSFRG